MSKHTPGPWKIGGAMISNGTETIALMLRRPAIFGGKRYATRDTDEQAPESGKTTDANARLIAAAPDLLAALESVLPVVDEYVQNVASIGSPADVALMLANAAILKAKGGAA